MAFDITWRSHGVVIRYKGIMSLDILIRGSKALFDDERYRTCLYQIGNFEDADFSRMSIAQIQKIAIANAGQSRAFPDIPTAIVTKSAIGEAMVFHYRNVADAHDMKWNVQRLQSMEAARKWRDEILSSAGMDPDS